MTDTPTSIVIDAGFFEACLEEISKVRLSINRSTSDTVIVPVSVVDFFILALDYHPSHQIGSYFKRELIEVKEKSNDSSVEP